MGRDVGQSMYALAQELWPICRSITGPGVRKTLQRISEEIPGLQILEVPTGTRCFDWEVPQEWTIHEAHIIDPEGRRIADFAHNNLHVVGYSMPVECDVTLDQLQEHLFSLPEQPDAIPYVTSYYEPRWGFCIPHSLRTTLRRGTYHVKIDSELTDGSLTYGEVLLTGSLDAEILLSTYVCHPSMANNELSGPCVATFIVKWLNDWRERRYSYRVVFVPETIGSICYLSQHHRVMKQRTVAGYVLTCIGDDGHLSYLSTPSGTTYADRIAAHVVGHMDCHASFYSFRERGSDERQYCTPLIDLPVGSLMRSKYGTYPEYHTSLDNLSFISADGLRGGYELVKRVIEAIELDCIPLATICCEPQLGKRGLYSTLSKKGSSKEARIYLDVLAYANGRRALSDMADLFGMPIWKLKETVDVLQEYGLLSLLPWPR